MGGGNANKADMENGFVAVAIITPFHGLDSNVFVHFRWVQKMQIAWRVRLCIGRAAVQDALHDALPVIWQTGLFTI